MIDVCIFVPYQCTYTIDFHNISNSCSKIGMLISPYYMYVIRI